MQKLRWFAHAWSCLHEDTKLHVVESCSQLGETNCSYFISNVSSQTLKSVKLVFN